MYGSVRSQFTQEYVQKSTRTTRPRSASAVSGSEFSQTGARSSAESALWMGSPLTVGLEQGHDARLATDDSAPLRPARVCSRSGPGSLARLLDREIQGRTLR